VKGDFFLFKGRREGSFLFGDEGDEDCSCPHGANKGWCRRDLMLFVFL
jgi:hypothetical protein